MEYLTTKNPKYIVLDHINNEVYDAETIEEAREAITELILEEGLYHPEADDFAIYKIDEVLKLNVIDEKHKHTEEEWMEITKGEYVDEICSHEFIKFNHQ